MASKDSDAGTRAGHEGVAAHLVGRTATEHSGAKVGGRSQTQPPHRGCRRAVRCARSTETHELWCLSY